MTAKKSKKEICRRRRRIALSIIAIFTILVISLIKFISFYSCDYRYAGLYAKHEHGKVIYEEAIPQGISEADEYVQTLFKKCKKMVNSSLQSYYFLNWNRLEECEMFYYSSSVASTGEIDEYAIACYNSSENRVYILPNLLNKYGEQYLKRVIIHELMHCLTYSKEIADTVFYEGIAEVLASRICKIYNLDFKYEYLINVRDYRTLENVFGQDATVYLLYNGRMQKEIDRYTQKGYGQELFEVLDKISVYSKHEDDLNIDKKQINYLEKVAQDILIHLTCNYANNLSDKNRANQIIENFENEFLLIKDEYFESILYEKTI